MLKNFRDLLALIYLGFLIIWFGMIWFLVCKLDVSVAEALGLGTVTGVFLTAFANMMQFYYRKANDAEKKP